MNVFKKSQVEVLKRRISLADKFCEYKIGQAIRFLDQWRQGIYITGIITDVGPSFPNGGTILKVRPVTQKGVRRDFNINSMHVLRA